MKISFDLIVLIIIIILLIYEICINKKYSQNIIPIATTNDPYTAHLESKSQTFH